jgi:phosphomannomutase
VQSVESKVKLGDANHLDGLKWDLPQGWVQVRASNTEPIVRVFAEARNEAEALAMVNTVLQALEGSR